ncbi:hypothetical protein D3C75_618400 [compost metagenome]
MDLLSRQPEGGDLQYGGAREAAVGEQHGLLEAGAILGGHRHRQADPGEIGESLFLFLMQGERHQTGAGGQHCEAELLCQLEAVGGGAEFRHGEAAGRHHQRVATDLALAGVEQEAVIRLVDGEDLGLALQGHPGPVTLGEQHLDYLLGALVTEQLAQSLLVIIHPVPVHQIDEVLLGVARQRRLAEVRIAREEGVGTGLMVGEVAATAAADEDLAARFLGVVQQQHGSPPITGLGRTHQAGRPGPDHHHIHLLHRHSPTKRKTALPRGRHRIRQKPQRRFHGCINRKRPTRGPYCTG